MFLFQKCSSKTVTNRRSKINNFITTILIRQLIQTINLCVTMLGFTMFARFGCRSAIFNKKMAPLMSKASKIYKKGDSNINVLHAKKLKPDLVWNVKMLNVENTFILNALEKKRSIWNNWTFKKSSILYFVKSMNP